MPFGTSWTWPLKRSMQMSNDGVPVVWNYAAGNWSQVDDPHVPDEDGFSTSFIWCDGMFELLQGPEGYRIDVCLDGSSYETITASGLPDLLDVLQKLAPIAQAALLNDVYDQMASVLAELERNADPSLREE